MYFKSNKPLCQLCEQKLHTLKQACKICAESIISAGHDFCENCQKIPSDIHHLYVFYAYDEPMKSLITQFKFKHGYDLTTYLCDLLIEKLPKEALLTECLLPAPMHPKKLRQRGFHQTHMLAKKLSQRLNLKISNNYLKKTKHTLAQSKLDYVERQHNLKESFYCRELPFKHVTIVDDIITTGATVRALAQTLQNQGVDTIDIWCLAKVNR
jgi:ComF family protein